MLNLLKFDITAADRTASAFGGVKRELGGIKGALAGVTDHARRAGRSMRNIGAGMSAAVTAPLAMIGKQSVQLYDQQVQAEKSVAQALTSTGNAAGRTLDQLKQRASALQGVTVFGDEDILREVTAPLLTFTKVQGEVFDRAQANILDMSTLLKMDLKSASILVGKALNDPVKGISALSRSGVQFSDAQKEVIKSLVETGDVAAAQTLILKELETQFQGQAATAASAPLGQWHQLSNAIGDLKEELGKEIVPFLKPVIEHVKSGVQWFSKLDPKVKQNIVVFGGLAAALGPVLAILGTATLGVAALGKVFAGLSVVLAVNPIVGTIAAIAGGAYLLYQNWAGVSAWAAGVWESVSAAFSTGWRAVETVLLDFTAAGLIYKNWDGIAAWYDLTFASVRTSFSIAWSGIKSLLSTTYSPQKIVYDLWEGIGGWFTALDVKLTQAFKDLWEAIKAEASLWPARFIKVGEDLIQGLIDGINQKWKDLKTSVSDLASGLVQSLKDKWGIKSPSRVFKAIGHDVVAGLGIGIRSNREIALGEIKDLAKDISDIGGQSTDFLGSVRDGAKTVFRDILTGAKSFKASLAGVLSGIGGRLLSRGIDGLFNAIWPSANGKVVSGGRIMAFANGGVVSSPTYFPLNNGTGLMGEAGPEAIMPLSRGPDGKLGVRATGKAAARAAQHLVEVVLHVPDHVTIEEVRAEADVTVRRSESRIVANSVQAAQRASHRSKRGFGI